jgi:hypothetical protein
MTDIDNLTKPLERYFAGYERGVITMMCERLGKILSADPGDIENLIKLQNISGDLSCGKKEKAEIIDKATPEIYNIVEDCAREYYDEARGHYGGELAPFGENAEIRRIVEQTKKAALACFADCLGSKMTGLTDYDGEFRYYEQGYRELVNEAVREVIS